MTINILTLIMILGFIILYCKISSLENIYRKDQMTEAYSEEIESSDENFSLIDSIKSIFVKQNNNQIKSEYSDHKIGF